MYCIDHISRRDYIPMHPPNFPKIQIEDNFLSQSECDKLVECVLDLPQATNLTPGVFDENYSNFSMIFNKYSKDDFLKNPHNLKPIYDIFEKIKLPNTNAYFFNPVILNGSNIVNPKKQSGIGYHYDGGSIGVCDENGRYYLAVCSTILYIKIPKVFIGGELKIHDFGYYECHNPGETRVKPKIGRKVTFRGDMRHAVSPIYSNENTQRISLAFDQYNIPEDRLNETSFRICYPT